eukprot:gene330-591_t
MKENIPESYGDNNDFGGVASMGLLSLQHEPQRLLLESQKINSQFEALVMENYRIFVENLTCSSQLRSEDNNLNGITIEFEEELRGLVQQCTAFRDRVGHFVNSHKRNRKTLQHHMQLVELLEVPQLVDACARNGFHDEALELANFVNGLERRHLLAFEVRSGAGSVRCGSSVVQGIVNEVQSTLLTLRQHLLQLLAEYSTLPKQIQLLASIRKLDGMLVDRQLAVERHSNRNMSILTDSQRETFRLFLIKSAETRLQMDFLEARGVWVDRLMDRALNDGVGATGALEQAGDLTTPTTDHRDRASAGSGGVSGRSGLHSPYGRTIEMLEVNRSAWFSIVTQFNALFEESAGLCSSSTILSTWASRSVQRLLTELTIVLPSLEDGAAMRSVLEQTLFFSDRMGQVGCDFTPLAHSVFATALETRLQNDWTAAAAQFKSITSTERFVFASESNVKEQVVPLFMSQVQSVETNLSSSSSSAPSGGVSQSRNGTGNGTGAEEVHAPSALLAYPPLAFLLNAFLIGLNFVRDCPISRSRVAIFNSMEGCLVDICHFLVATSKDIRKLGNKYLDKDKDKYEGKVGVQKKGSAPDVLPIEEGSGNDSSPYGSVQSSSMDVQYGEAMTGLLIPHVMMCFNAIFSTSSTSMGVGAGAGVTNEEDHKVLVLVTETALRRCEEILLKGSLIRDSSSRQHSVSVEEDAKSLSLTRTAADRGEQLVSHGTGTGAGSSRGAKLPSKRLTTVSSAVESQSQSDATTAAPASPSIGATDGSRLDF